MIGFIYSEEMAYRYEYQTIRDFLQNNYKEGSDYILLSIENLHVLLNGDITVLLGKERLDVESLEKVYLIDLGNITLTTLSYRIYLLKYFEELGISVINSPETILLCRNKLATYFALKKYNLSVIQTIGLSRFNKEKLNNYILKLNQKLIVKPLLGSMGIGVELVGVKKVLSEIEKRLGEENILIIQKYIPTKDSCDIRVLVIGENVLSGMKRCAKKGSILTNIFQDSTPHPIVLSEDIRSIAIKAAKAIDGEIVTIDFIRNNETNDVFILEINGFARWRGMQKVTKFDITEKLVKYLMEGVL